MVCWLNKINIKSEGRVRVDFGKVDFNNVKGFRCYLRKWSYFVVSWEKVIVFIRWYDMINMIGFGGIYNYIIWLFGGGGK